MGSKFVRAQDPLENPLTPEQIRWVTQCFARWLMIRYSHEIRTQWGPIGLLPEEKRLEAFKSIMSQMNADVGHSALLMRLLSGKEELPEPPPLKYSYPVYPDE